MNTVCAYIECISTYLCMYPYINMEISTDMYANMDTCSFVCANTTWKNNFEIKLQQLLDSGPEKSQKVAIETRRTHNYACQPRNFTDSYVLFRL